MEQMFSLVADSQVEQNYSAKCKQNLSQIRIYGEKGPGTNSSKLLVNELKHNKLVQDCLTKFSTSPAQLEKLVMDRKHLEMVLAGKMQE